MAYIPNPDKPGELNEIEQAFRELRKCQRAGGGWDLMDLNKWLETYPDSVWNDLQQLDNWFDAQFPPVQQSIVAQSGEAHGSLRAHHHQAS